MSFCIGKAATPWFARRSITMIEQAHCTGLLVAVVNYTYDFLKSDSGHVAFFTLMMLRAIFHYCGKCPHPEAKDLQSALIVSIFVALFIMATELSVPASLVQALSCDSPSTRQARLGSAHPTSWPPREAAMHGKKRDL
jgi:hypothetical protein